MARSQAKVFVTIWTSPEWLGLSVHAQWMYVVLLTQSKLSLAGCVDLMPARWAALSETADLGLVRAALGELEAAEFIAIDQATGEVLIRTFVVHDVASGTLNRNIVKGFWSAWEAILSPDLRQIVVNNVPEAIWERSNGHVPPEAHRRRSARLEPRFEQRLQPQSQLRSEPQSEPQFEPQSPVDNAENGKTAGQPGSNHSSNYGSNQPLTAYRLPSAVATAVATESDPTSSTAPAEGPGGGGPSVLLEAAHLLAIAEADRRGGEISNRSGYIADRTPKLRNQHETAWQALLEANPTLTAEQLAASTTQPRPAGPADQAAAAQRLRDQRLAARARGEACSDCDGVGVTDNGDGTYTRCEACA